jgi:hypothetical protein
MHRMNPSLVPFVRCKLYSRWFHFHRFLISPHICSQRVIVPRFQYAPPPSVAIMLTVMASPRLPATLFQRAGRPQSRGLGRLNGDFHMEKSIRIPSAITNSPSPISDPRGYNYTALRLKESRVSGDYGRFPAYNTGHWLCTTGACCKYVIFSEVSSEKSGVGRFFLRLCCSQSEWVPRTFSVCHWSRNRYTPWARKVTYREIVNSVWMSKVANIC